MVVLSIFDLLIPSIILIFLILVWIEDINLNGYGIETLFFKPFFVSIVYLVIVFMLISVRLITHDVTGFGIFEILF